MKKSSAQAGTTSFDLTVDKLPYHIDVTPFSFNDEKRFEVRINGDGGHVFVWDPEIVGLRAIDDDSALIPDVLEKAISDKLVKTVIE